jgi:hypothetical protein
MTAERRCEADSWTHPYRFTKQLLDSIDDALDAHEADSAAGVRRRSFSGGSGAEQAAA